ncbi:hypothetical protein J6590_010518 [Homalodisca vitripennis]|nr:hypothetical protein J6590_010518 [Homalodisca vitripennis]
MSDDRDRKICKLKPHFPEFVVPRSYYVITHAVSRDRVIGRDLRCQQNFQFEPQSPSLRPSTDTD